MNMSCGLEMLHRFECSACGLPLATPAEEFSIALYGVSAPCPMCNQPVEKGDRSRRAKIARWKKKHLSEYYVDKEFEQEFLDALEAGIKALDLDSDFAKAALRTIEKRRKEND